MEHKKMHSNISGQLLKVLSADEQERELEDSVRDDGDDEPTMKTIEESPEAEEEEAATEMGFVRHIGERRPE